ncbi:MAG: response regulator transcription factor [Sporomusaceae bacterium]|nr:response regulator transcription factor [Sporomusaceae bacterium]
MRVLLAEDDCRLGKLVKHMLQKNNIQADWVLNGEAACDYALYGAYDVVVLDWLMPVRTGIEACVLLRRGGYQGAILMLTAKDALSDRVQGLDSGADDYVVKPFEFAELLARLRALSRRSLTAIQDETLQIGNFSIHCTSRQVLYNEQEIQLSGREFQLLDLLARNRNAVVPRAVLLDRVWGLETEVSSNSLDAYIHLLRKKLGLPVDGVMISNVRGVGYKLEV